MWWASVQTRGLHLALEHKILDRFVNYDILGLNIFYLCKNIYKFGLGATKV